MQQRPHWSYSALHQYLRCPLQYYFQRILRIPSPTLGSGLALGSVIHSVLAEYHQRLKDGLSIQAPALFDAIAQHWQAKEAVEQIQFRGGETRNDTIALGVHLIELYLTEPPPENILAVEEEFLVPLQNSQGEYLETPLLAIVDLLTFPSDRLRVHEFKTSGRSYSQADVTLSLQPTCYFHAVTERTAQEPEIEYTVLVKTKSPKIQHLRTDRTTDACRRLGDLTESIQRAVDTRAFYPIESPLNCSGCAYRRQCRDWKPARESNASTQLQPIEECATCLRN